VLRWAFARRRTRAIVAVCAVGISSLAVVATVRPSAQDATRVELTVATFNIEYGGHHVSFDAVVRAIRRSGADVVGVEEAQLHIPRLARQLGWAYFSDRLQVVSQLPLIDPPGGDSIYLYVEVAPGQVVALENIHLPSNPYGPFRVKQGEARREVVARERSLRLPAIRPSLRKAQPLVEAGIPVFLVGDFNAPSWRDWTADLVGLRPHIRYAVRWPVSLAVERAGFVDSYRAVYPDARRLQGLTWWADRPELPGWDPGKHAPQDRIDFVYAAGNATPTSSLIVGERGSPISDLSVSPWPTDHRMVASTFDVTPGAMPVLVAVDQRVVDVGDDVEVRFHAPGEAGERIVIVPAGGDPAVDAIATQTTRPASPVDGTLTFATETFGAGSYEAVLVDRAGTPLAQIGVWVKEPGTGPQISTAQQTYGAGEPIDVHWTLAPGRRWDWVGVYRRDADPKVAWYLLWAYTGATIEGSLTLDGAASGRFPLEAGRYSVYLLTDDSYKKVAGRDFRIVD
jgi:endonuclease/exonuclease/phosphatase family metal-dependent hydrolase